MQPPVHGPGRRGALLTVDRPEPELARRAVAGDRQAFAALVEAHWARLVRIARSVVGEAVAEDAVQDGLLQAWLALGSLKRPEAFTPWLTRVVLRRCLRERRRRPATVELGEAPEPATARDAGAGMVAGLDVARLLAALAPRQRAVMHLTVVEGLSDGEIGSLLEIAPASVRAHRRRAREALDRLVSAPPNATRARKALS